MKRKISIIIPVFNVENFIEEALESIVKQTIGLEHLEVIMVDDYSTDKSGEIIDEYADKYENFTAIHLTENSGAAGKPRNIGMEKATSDYLMFLDPDDYYMEDACEILYEKIVKENADMITGKFTILLENGAVNKASSWYKLYSTSATEIKNIKQENKNLLYSSPPSVWAKIFKRDFIEKNNIIFPEKIPGQDLVFVMHCFLKTDEIIYINQDILVLRKRQTKDKSISYIRNNTYINGLIQAYTILNQICNDNNEEKEFPLMMENRFPYWFNQFVSSDLTIFEKKEALKSIKPLLEIYHKSGFTLPDRFMPTLECIIDEKFDDALLLLYQLKDSKETDKKKRLLVVGHDLKFIEPALKYLEGDYDIKIDRWENHFSHDKQKSTELLNWADFIFCEWLLGNAVWYSKMKLKHQKLIIRTHKFEISQNFGNQVDFKNVDGVIAISYYFLELFSSVFKIPRQKMIMLSNYIETNIYTGVKTDDFRYNLAIVGYMPRYKGLLKGFKILKMLREHDEKFKLHLIGKNYKEVSWVWNNHIERSYFQECENFIKENNLEDSVIFEGWIERSKIFNNIGYVLSVSDLEGSHQAPAEGLADGTLALLLNWEGAEYIYPEKIIFNNINDIKDMILSTYKNEDKYYGLLNEMRDYVITEFSIEKFVDELKFILQKIEVEETTKENEIKYHIYPTLRNNSKISNRKIVDLKQDDSNLFTFTITDPEPDETYAWYILENGKKVDMIWYTPNNVLKYFFTKPGKYKIKYFVKKGENIENYDLPQTISIKN